MDALPAVEVSGVRSPQAAVITLPADLAGNAAPGHGLLHARLQHVGRNRLGDWQLGLQLDNLLDRRHAASVIVGEASGRFLEPGAPRRGAISWRQTRR
ncbi:MAG: hypothetical protein ACK4F7_10680 [Inhella sp.]